MFDVIERLKSEWTDKYVVIDSQAPELARFANATGTVKTVNMNGRCLVEFDQFNNIGWYDIDPSALKIVAQPRPKPVEKEPVKAAPKATPAAAPAAAKAKPAGGRPSTADILAAARGKAAAAKAPPTTGGKPSTAEILARARAAKAAPAATPAAEPDAPVETEAAAPPASAPKASSPGPLPTSTAEKIAWCRSRDGKNAS